MTITSATLNTCFPAVLTGLLLTLPLWIVTVTADSISTAHLALTAATAVMTTGLSKAYTSQLRKRINTRLPIRTPPFGTVLTALLPLTMGPAIILSSMSPVQLAFLLISTGALVILRPGRREAVTHGGPPQPSTPPHRLNQSEAFILFTFLSLMLSAMILCTTVFILRH